MISKEERSIIAAIELQGRVPLTVIAKQLKQKIPTLRRRLESLRRQEILQAKRAYINLYPLGYINYILYFSLSAKIDSSKLIQTLKEEPSVTWLCEVGGDFQYGVSIAAKDPFFVSDFIEKLDNAYPSLIYDKILSTRLSIRTWSRKYLSSKKINEISLFQGPYTICQIDRIDEEIIEVIAVQQDSSDRELSKLLSIPVTTFHRRIKNLEQKKIITGYQYLFSPDKLNISSYRFLLETRSSGVAFRKELLDFSASHLYVHKFVHCLGAWDFELEVDVKDVSAVGSIRTEILDAFGSKISRIRIIPLIQNIPTAFSFSSRP